MTSLKQTLNDKTEKAAREALEKAQRENATQSVIAEAFDTAAQAVGYSGALPDMIFAHSLCGEAGALHWPKMAFDDALSIMRAFPAVPSGMYRGDCTSFRPTDSLSFPLKAGESFDEHAVGYAMRLSGGLEYGQRVVIDWWADLAGTRVRIAVELTGPHDVLPRLYCRVNTYQGRFVSIERGTETAVFPLGDAPSQAAKYGSASDKSYGDRLYVGETVADYMVRAVAFLDEKGRETAAAYARAKATIPAGVPSVPEIDAFAGTMRAAYGKTKLNAGTLRQTAALKMPEALANRKLAETHWPRYAADPDNLITDEPAREYFDSYAWECSWLCRCGILTDEHDGKPYRYGTAWL